MEPYIILYKEFMKSYASGVTTGEQVGELIAKLAGFYPNYNTELAYTERAFALICRDEVCKSDDMTGKAVSATKAETISNASDEAFAYEKAKAHVANLEMLIQSAKALQRGLLQEMVHSNLN